MNPENQKVKTFQLNSRTIENNKTNTFQTENSGFHLFNKSGEPAGVNRFRIIIGELEAELLPSKGLSLGQVLYKGKKIFWDAPYDLTDPDDLDLWSDEVFINGKPAPGFAFLPTFAAGIELYGLKNWGMPRLDNDTGVLNPLHGETSNIPVDEMSVEINENAVIVSAAFIYRDMSAGNPRPWYMNGQPMYKVYKYYRFGTDPEPTVIIRDTIENMSEKVITPDWGYHITFYPMPGTKLLTGSASVEERSGGELPADIETWVPAEDQGIRQETGIIHKGLMKTNSGSEERSSVLIQHPTGSGTLFSFPLSPYFQTWMCKGGAGSYEFSRKSGESLLKKNWDGLGIEIGSSALDHNGNTDNSVRYKGELNPGEKKTIEMEMSFPDQITTEKLAAKINQFNQARK